MRKAVAKGYDHLERLNHDPCLDPIREREDFRKLLGLPGRG